MTLRGLLFKYYFIRLFKNKMIVKNNKSEVLLMRNIDYDNTKRFKVGSLTNSVRYYWKRLM